MKSAIIFLLVNCCAFLFSQELKTSRNFISFKKSLPAQIINHHPTYFYVVRQNKIAHDITIERRAKPSAEIISFTPLKLDSVNASWFDYENLDYTVFESNYRLYFVFEKVLNNKKTVYLKIIDTTGRASGFIELASMEKDSHVYDFYFTWKVTLNNDLLLVSTKNNLNGTIRREAMLYSTQERRLLWTRKLPPEITRLAFSIDVTCNKNNDLLYLQERHSVAETHTYGGVTRTVTQLDSLILWRWKSADAYPVPHTLDIWGIYWADGFIVPKGDTAFVSVKGVEEDTVKNVSYEVIYNIGVDPSGNELFNVREFYRPEIREKLTFYDGPSKESYFKDHLLSNTYIYGNAVYALFDRDDSTYYKELVFRKINLQNGAEQIQKLIPRKIFYFPNRTRFKQLAQPMLFYHDSILRVITIEHPNNFQVTAGTFNYTSFRKAGGVSNANLVAYLLKPNGDFEKTLIYKNAAFDLVPLKYSGTQKDMVFYLYNSKFEKFAIWSPSP